MIPSFQKNDIQETDTNVHGGPSSSFTLLSDDDNPPPPSSPHNEDDRYHATLLPEERTISSCKYHEMNDSMNHACTTTTTQVHTSSSPKMSISKFEFSSDPMHYKIHDTSKSMEEKKYHSNIHPSSTATSANAATNPMVDQEIIHPSSNQNVRSSISNTNSNGGGGMFGVTTFLAKSASWLSRQRVLRQAEEQRRKLIQETVAASAVQTPPMVVTEDSSLSTGLDVSSSFVASSSTWISPTGTDINSATDKIHTNILRAQNSKEDNCYTHFQDDDISTHTHELKNNTESVNDSYQNFSSPQQNVGTIHPPPAPPQGEEESKKEDVITVSVGQVTTSVSGQGASVNFNVFEFVRKRIRPKRGERMNVQKDKTYKEEYDPSSHYEKEEEEEEEKTKFAIDIKIEPESIPDDVMLERAFQTLQPSTHTIRERSLHDRSTKKYEMVPYILSQEQMKLVGMKVVPSSLLYFSKWKRLYCLQRDGDAFEGTFLRKVQGEAKTLIIVQTSNGHKFGGYAECPWESQTGGIGGVFYGTAGSCLFAFRKKKEEKSQEELQAQEDTLGRNGKQDKEEELIVYKWTGANRYIQICDVHAKMLAFGGGGKQGEFGLCVEDDFRKGSTGPCETFGNEPLCEDDRFDIVNLECWGFSGACL